MTLTNDTEGWTRSATKSYSPAQRYSAEVIAEAPSSSSGVLPLSNFGTVNLSASLANGQPIGNHSPNSINMVSGSTMKATTASLPGGKSFSVSWKHS